jgi:hypothetical protein
LKKAYDIYQNEEADAYLASLPREEYDARIAASCAEMRRGGLRRISDEELARMAHADFRVELKKSGRIVFLSLEEFGRLRPPLS